MVKRGGGKIILFILIITVLIAAIYFTFFFSYKCEDIACFNAHKEKCSRVKFINDKEDVTWQYNIKGKTDGECKIDTKLLQVKLGAINVGKLEGQSMICYIPLGSTAEPGSDLSRCHGLLKEGLQEIMITNLHAEIRKNIGQIASELEKVI
ncbi:MAG: hypothetical protein KKA64_01180 [Nanoarchaeota archaeon]|nr:hypothetical protein [Nanoarchaeota archaeon]